MASVAIGGAGWARGRPRIAAPEVDEPAARFRDLALLATLARIGALVIAAEQQDEAVSVSVAEHARQDALTPRLVSRGLVERTQNLPAILTQAKLEQPSPSCLP